ncbi:predicted protein [Verticillium alfalfae VaMs.102]|uniref:Predicted protein n=1 Tax=Verticillium alfalfae (strain VaMs.102 / ATCC MYA-4576 / FGSC 10136) TaxID=526221 RepID=C9S9I0_VERA1|nr:predicted protein [Verticillium alfalfae VaMs.102]EEY16043.1 predicted protein [Verticillium alfalfae VaMs.102]
MAGRKRNSNIWVVNSKKKGYFGRPHFARLKNFNQTGADATELREVSRKLPGETWIEKPWDISTDSDFVSLQQIRDIYAAESDVPKNENTAHSEEGFLEEAQDQHQMTQRKGLAADYVPLVDAADGALRALLESSPSLDDRVAELSIEASTVLADARALQIRVKELIARRDDIVTKLADLDNTGTALQSPVARVTQALREEPHSMFTLEGLAMTKHKGSGDLSNAKPMKRVKPIRAFAGG